MITTLEMFGVECDNCKEDFSDDYSGFCAWSDGGLAQEQANDAGWHCTDEGKHYCPKCFHFDDEDNLIIHELKI